VRALNQDGVTDIVAVDNLTQSDKFKNLVGCEISDYIHKDDIIEILSGHSLGYIEAVVHQGACSSTTESNGRYMMDNNYRFSRLLLDWCIEHKKPFIYASSAAVYGDGAKGFREETECEGPLNVYGYSKYLFDQHVRTLENRVNIPLIGFRYFNVYGPGEHHKRRMSSVAFHHYQQYTGTGKVRLFEGSDGYGDGEQSRDFVYVEDVVKANMWALGETSGWGILNVGTGRAQPFNDIAVSVVNGVRAQKGESTLSREEMVSQGILEYVPFPEDLKGKYQSYTQADLSKLRDAGCDVNFRSVEEGVADYIPFLASWK
jgi:ADP-L-glycero-D-manno-heptose 6-epimerase